MSDPETTDATAACGAYLLVALADARVEEVEEARFLGGVVNEPAFRDLPAAALAGEYNRLLAALREDWDGTEAEILRAIADTRDDPAAVKLAARNAVIADQIIKPQEEYVLAKIAAALRLAPDEL